MKKPPFYYFIFAGFAILCILVVLLVRNIREPSSPGAIAHPSVSFGLNSSRGDTKPAKDKEREIARSSPRENPDVSAPSSESDMGKGPILVVFGKVSLSDGSPAKEADLELKKLEAEKPSLQETLIMKTAVDKEGRYRMTVPDDKSLFIFVHQKGYASLTGVIPEPDQLRAIGKKSGKREVSRDFVLNPASFIKGYVKDEKDTPLSQITIRAFSTKEIRYYERFTMSEVKSDDKGNFTIEDIPPGETFLGVETPDYSPYMEKVSAPADNVLVKLLSQGCSISGHVYLKSTGEPVTGAAVQLSFIHPVPYLRRLSDKKGLSHPDGAFAFDRLAQGSYVIRAEKENLRLFPLKGSLNNQVVLTHGEKRSGLELFLYEGHTIRGRVTEKNLGAPIDGVKVSLSSDGNREIAFDETDLDGFYVLNGITQNKARLTTEKQSYIMVPDPEEDNFVALSLPQESLEVTKDLQMIKGVTISGKVETPEGLPVTNANVFISQSVPGNLHYVPHPVDGSGCFKIAALVFSSCFLKAETPEFPPTYSEEIMIRDKPIENVILVINQGCSIKGIVIDPDKKPVEKARIQVIYWLGHSGEGIANNLLSDQRGYFEMSNLSAGKVEIYAQKQGYAYSNRIVLTLARGEEKSGLTFELRPSTFLAGKITNPEGAPIEGVYVNVQSMNYEMNSRGFIRTDKDGHYRIEGLINTPHHVNLEHSKYGEKSIKDVEVGRENADFVMGDEKKPFLIGNVVDGKTGKPVENFTVTSLDHTRPEKDPNVPGRFIVKDLNNYENFGFRIEAPGYSTLETESINFFDDKDVKEKTFELGSGGSIVGRVIRGETNEPLAGVSVQWYGAMSDWDLSKRQPEQILTTGGDGMFRIDKAPAGQNLIKFHPQEPFSDKTRQIMVRHGEVANLGDVAIGSGGTIKGLLVQMPDETPLSGKKISISGIGRGFHQAKNTITDADGRFEFHDMTNDSYIVYSEEYNVLQNVELSEEVTQECILRVGTGTLKGIVLKDGKPKQSHVILKHVSLSLSLKSLDTDPKGAFEVTGLAPGRWKLFIMVSEAPFNDFEEYVDISSDSVTEKTFELKTSSGRILGRVLNIKEAPVAGVIVSARLPQPADALWDHTQTWNVLSKEDGSFILENVKPDSYTVFALKERLVIGLVENVIVPSSGDAAPVIIKIGEKENGVLVSVALNAANGAPVSDAWCYLSSRAGARFEHDQNRGADGILRIPDIPSATYLVQVSAPGFSVHERLVEIKPGETVEIQDMMYEAGALRLTIVDSKWMPQADMSCILEPLDASSMDKVREGKTDMNGVWIQHSLYPGEYKATASHADGRQVSQIIRIQARQLVHQTMILK